MKCFARIIGVTTFLTVAAFAGSGTASANCIPNKTLSSIAEAYCYVNVPPGNDNDTIVGRFWSSGARALANEGTYADSHWLRFYPPTSKWYILGELGTAGIVGCISSSLILTLDTLSGHNLTIQIDETPGGAAAFNLSRFNTDFSLGQRPRPTVSSSSRTGTTINLQLNVAAQTAGIYTLGTAVAATPTYRIVSAVAASDPGGLASSYAAGPAITPGSPLTFPASCANPASDHWIAVQSITDGVPSDTVGPRTRIVCNGFLADPKFKHIDRPARPSPRSGR